MAQNKKNRFLPKKLTGLRRSSDVASRRSSSIRAIGVNNQTHLQDRQLHSSSVDVPRHEVDGEGGDPETGKAEVEGKDDFHRQSHSVINPVMISEGKFMCQWSD